MLLHELKRGPKKQTKKRLWRWNSSWKWNYSTKWLKWQLARSGGWQPSWFEWGQTPLWQRLPKLRWFKKYFKLIKEYQLVNLDRLEKDERIKDQTINKKLLKELNYIRKEDWLVKILWNWNFSKKLVFEWIDKLSESAKQKIEKLWWEIK